MAARKCDGAGIVCPSCRSPRVDVKDSRPSGDMIRRRRLCVACGSRFTTHEMVILAGDAGEVHNAIRWAGELDALPPRARGLIRELVRAIAVHDARQGEA